MSHELSHNEMQSPETPPVPLSNEENDIHIERGVCYVFFAYDVGISIHMDVAERRITSAKRRPSIRQKRKTPRYFEYHPPPIKAIHEMAPITLGRFHTTAQSELTLYDFGAISVCYEIPIEGPMRNLQALSDLLYDNDELHRLTVARVEEMLAVIGPAVTKPHTADIVEDYVIYQIQECSPGTIPDILQQHGQTIACILRASDEPLSAQEVGEVLAARASYGEEDLVITDWNAAMLFDREADDVRMVLEYTNVELLEMRYLDDRLDNALDESYSRLNNPTWKRRWMWVSQSDDLRRVAELQVDSALLFEGVNNALKLVGDQYLARVYQSAAQRLHMQDWDNSILRKLNTLESIYEKMSDHHAHWRMEILEWIIIILIAISILLTFIPGGGH